MMKYTYKKDYRAKSYSRLWYPNQYFVSSLASFLKFNRNKCHFSKKNAKNPEKIVAINKHQISANLLFVGFNFSKNKVILM